MTGALAVLPVKGFGTGKSRLGGVLTDPVRAAFARGLFEHVIGALEGAARLDGVIVVTADPEVTALARARGHEVVPDPPTERLGQVVDAGLQRAAERGASSALVCMADLPRLTSREIDGLLAQLEKVQIAVVPDDVEGGTNALALCPPDAMASCFGHADSFQRHQRRARDRGLALRVHRSPGLCFDVDQPADLQRVCEASEEADAD